MASFPLLTTVPWIALTVYSIYIIKKRIDYVPLIICLASLSFIARYYAIASGLDDWVNYDYGIPIVFSEELGVRAINYISGGLLILYLSYLLFRKYPWRPEFDFYEEETFKQFLFQSRQPIIIGLILAQLAGIYFGARAYFVGGLNSSYILYLPFMAASMIILGFLLLKYKATGDGLSKFFVLSFVIVNIPNTIMSGQRFIAIAWIIPLILIASHKINFKYKLLGIILLPVISLNALLLLGLNRYSWFSAKDFTTQLQISSGDILKFRDFNMVDGMVMLFNVFPQYLDYRNGAEHLNIILRVIPRQIWEDKPVGSWMMQLAVQNNQDLFTAGFGSSLIGDFYMEFGGFGVIFLPIVYGYLLAKLMNYTSRYYSEHGFVLGSVITASLVPILRGGDIAGIFSVVLMTYWPIILFDFNYRRFLLRHRFMANL